MTKSNVRYTFVECRGMWDYAGVRDLQCVGDSAPKLVGSSDGGRRRLASAQRVPVFHRSTLKRGRRRKKENLYHQPEEKSINNAVRLLLSAPKKCKFDSQLHI